MPRVRGDYQFINDTLNYDSYLRLKFGHGLPNKPEFLKQRAGLMPRARDDYQFINYTLNSDSYLRVKIGHGLPTKRAFLK